LLAMPTLTTTVTSACASGTTTTVTTTEATPDSGATHPNVVKIRAALGAWGAGELQTAEGCAKWMTPDCKWTFANAASFTNTDIIKTYTGPAGVAEWCNNNLAIDWGPIGAGPDAWQFAGGDGFVTATIPNQRFGVHATGKYTTADGDYMCTFYYPNGSEKCAGCHHQFPVSLNDCFAGGALNKAEAMLAGWAAGELLTADGCAKYVTPDCKWTFANAAAFSNTDIIKTYTGADGLAEWCNANQDIDFGPLEWIWAVNDDFITGTITNPKMGIRSTGKYTAPDGDYICTFHFPNGGACAGVHHQFPIGLNECFEGGSHSPLTKTKLLLQSWIEGKYDTVEGVAEDCSDDAVWTFSNAQFFNRTKIFKVGGYKGPAGVHEWCQLNKQVDFGPLGTGPDAWLFAVNGDFVTASIPSQKFGVVATGKYTAPQRGMCVFDFTGGGKCRGCHHYLPMELNDCF